MSINQFASKFSVFEELNLNFENIVVDDEHEIREIELIPIICFQSKFL